jgi:hypothetical protein
MDKNISIFPYMGKIAFVEWVNFSLYGKNHIRGMGQFFLIWENRIRGIAEKNNSH